MIQNRSSRTGGCRRSATLRWSTCQPAAPWRDRVVMSSFSPWWEKSCPFGQKEALGLWCWWKYMWIPSIIMKKPVVFQGFLKKPLYFHHFSSTNGKRTSMLMIIFSIDGGFLQWSTPSSLDDAGWFISLEILPKWMMTGGTTILGHLHIYIY